MIYIDLPADLNMEDDDGRNVARLALPVRPVQGFDFGDFAADGVRGIGRDACRSGPSQ